jgi:hypothetical protein
MRALHNQHYRQAATTCIALLIHHCFFLVWVSNCSGPSHLLCSLLIHSPLRTWGPIPSTINRNKPTHIYSNKWLMNIICMHPVISHIARIQVPMAWLHTSQTHLSVGEPPPGRAVHVIAQPRAVIALAWCKVHHSLACQQTCIIAIHQCDSNDSGNQFTNHQDEACQKWF